MAESIVFLTAKETVSCHYVSQIEVVNK